MITVWIDGLFPCLQDAKTKEMVNTEVLRIKRKTFLRKYNKRNGWYVNWAELANENDIYALVLEGSVDIQGLVAVHLNHAYKAAYISWMVASPENNKQITDDVRYLGVGGHLFAIASDISLKAGYGGYVTGVAANRDLLHHYIDTFHADVIGQEGPYHFAIDEENTLPIREVYTYEWADDEL